MLMNQRTVRPLLLLVSLTILCKIYFKTYYIDSDEVRNELEFPANSFNYSVIDVTFEEIIKGHGQDVLPQDDPQLINYIRQKIHPPSKKPYNLAKPQIQDQTQFGQPTVIRQILGEMRNGFFVECGAHDGEFLSNTLAFEIIYGWNGLLVEAYPEIYTNLTKKERKAWSIEACLSIKEYPITVKFESWSHVPHRISKKSGESMKNGYNEVQCLPLYSILVALNTTTVDYFSLDIEGDELEMLKTIPWDKVNIKTISIEFNHVPNGKEIYTRYMASQGYYLYCVHHIDLIFYKKDIIPKMPAP